MSLSVTSVKCTCFKVKVQFAEDKMEEDNFVVKNYVLNDIEQKEHDNAIPV